MTTPKPAQAWRHFKGTLYIIVGVSRDSEAWDDESKHVVVYFNADRPPGLRPSLIHRPLSMWTEPVERDGYVGPRYVLETEVAPERMRESLEKTREDLEGLLKKLEE